MQHFASEAAADPLPEKSQEETRRKQEPRYLNRKKKDGPALIVGRD